MVYVPDSDDIAGYKEEIRHIFYQHFSVPVSAVSIEGPTDARYYSVVVMNINECTDQQDALDNVEIAFVESSELPVGTSLVFKGI